MVVINKVIDYETLINKLMQLVPSIYAVVIIEEENKIIFSTDNWDISEDVKNLCSSWNAMKAPFIIVSGVKYTMLECEIDSIVATSLRGEGHIVGVKDEERKFITYVEPNGDRKAVIVELSRILRTLSSKEPYMDLNAQFDDAYTAAGKKGADYINSELKNEIEGFLSWIKDPLGLSGYIDYYLQKNNDQIISELSKIYIELRQIFGV